MAQAKAEKRKFQMPHLLFLLLGLMLFMSILTYILPAGEFTAGADGAEVYTPLPRTPVSPIDAMLLLYDGIANSGSIIALLLGIGGSVTVILGTKSLDRLIDLCLYKLQDKGPSILVPVMFLLMVFLGAFNATDALIAVIPIGVMFAKKLRLDPITAAATTLLATLIGFATSPIGIYVAQMLMGVPVYSGFGFRMINMLLCGFIGAVYVTIYARKILKDPSRSAMGHTDWLLARDVQENASFGKLEPGDIPVTILFLGQFPVIIYLMLSLGMGLKVMPAVMIPVSILCGLLHRMSFNEIGSKFEEGVRGMPFVCMVVGMASAISMIMQNGKIIDTIAYYACMPLKGLGSGLASVGISIVVLLLNFFIPSATAKAAALIPIIQPMAENLAIPAQVTVQAFQIGDGFCNAISPFLGWTMGGLAIAGVPYQKWVKWAAPLIAIYLIVEYALLILLNTIGWA